MGLPPRPLVIWTVFPLTFLTPWTREAKLNWLRRQYDAEIHDRRLDIEQGQSPSVVAHSFGTYILGYTLLRFDFIRFNKVILCGSILPREFPWDKLIERGQVQAIRNEYGVRDPWVKLVSCFVRGTGPSGAFGFTCNHDRLEQEEFEYDHGDYFGIDHVEDRWIPFLNKPLAEIPRAQDGPRIPRPHTPHPGACGLVLALALLAGAVVAYVAPSRGTELTTSSPAAVLSGYVADAETRATLADVKQLHGVVFSVEDGQADRRYLANVLVTVVEFGASGTTNDQGGFRVRLPAGVLPGQDVTLQEDQRDYYILFPVLSKLRVPAMPGQVVEVWMAPKGSKVLLGANFIEQFIIYTAERLIQEAEGPEEWCPDLSSYVNELARQSGRPAEEILGQIGRSAAEAKESDDPRKLGLAAFAEKKFRLAAENFRLAADAEKRRGAEGFRKSDADHSFEGDCYSNALNCPKALQAYQAALGDLKVYRKGRDDLGLPAYPEYTSDVQALALKIANAKVALGTRVAGPDSRRHLEEAVREYLGLIAQVPRSSDPRRWAMTQHNLGSALRALGERLAGPEGLRRLSEAVAAYHQALTVRKRDDLPQDWARTQNNLGIALGVLGKRQGGPEGLRRLSEAVEAYRLALTVFTRDDLPQKWAMTQNNLGNASCAWASGSAVRRVCGG